MEERTVYEAYIKLFIKTATLSTISQTVLFGKDTDSIYEYLVYSMEEEYFKAVREHLPESPKAKAFALGLQALMELKKEEKGR